MSPQSTVCCRNTQFSPTQDGLDASCPCPASGPSSRCLPCNQKFQRGHHPLQGTSWTSALEGLARLTHTRQPPFYTLLCRKGVRVAAPLLLLIPGPRLRELGKHQQAMLGAVRTLWFSNHITHPVRDQKHGRHTLAESHSPLRVTTAAPLTHHTLPHRLFRRCLQTRAYICGHTHACTHTHHIHTYTRARTHTRLRKVLSLAELFSVPVHDRSPSGRSPSGLWLLTFSGSSVTHTLETASTPHLRTA